MAKPTRQQQRALERQRLAQAQQPGGAAFSVQSTTYSGPLPPTEDLARLDEIVPGAARIIVTEFQAQSRHRRQMERLVVISDAIRAQVGMLIGGGLSIYIVWTGGTLLRDGHTLAGFEAIGSAIALAAGPFIVRNVLQSKERADQQRALPGARNR